MTQILSAAHKPYSTQQFLAAELETLMRNLPGNTKQKYKHAQRILKALLNTKVNSKSAVQKILLQTANHVAQTYNRPDTYPNQTSVPNVTNTSKDNPEQQSQYPDRQSCVQANVNAGFSLAAANANCNRYFPPGPATQGGVERRTNNINDHGGGHSKTTIYYPTKSGFKQNPERLETYRKATGSTKSASIDGIPYWAYTVMSEQEINDAKLRLSSGPTHVRSAKQQEEVDQFLHDTSIAGVLERRAEMRKARVEHNNLKSAALEDEKPAWLRALWAFKGVDV